MLNRRCFVGGISLAAFLPAAARAQNGPQRHWLIGDWVGSRDAREKGGMDKYGTDRVLTVRSVAADGKSATGVWQSTGKMTVKLTIDGDRVRFSTSAGNVSGSEYDLTHKGDTLTGTYTDTVKGRPGAMTLTKRQ